MKSYTDIEQSKKLAEILPVESADMCWTPFDEEWDAYLGAPNPDAIKKEIPCWSLAALLDQLEDVICDEDGNEYQLRIIKEGVQYYLVYDGMDVAAYYDTPLFDDLVDACVDMILILKEKDLL